MSKPQSAESIIKNAKKEIHEPVTPIGTELILPNYSGVKDEVRKTATGDIVTAIDDGNYIRLYTKGTLLLRIRKSDMQLQLAAGIDTDTIL